MDLTEFRASFPSLRTRTHLFAGATCPLARPVRSAVDLLIATTASQPMTAYGDAWRVAAQFRHELAELLGATPDRIAIADNTSRASSLAVRIAARRRPRGNVVIDSTAYPSSIYGWIVRGQHTMRAVSDDGADPAQATDRILSSVDRETAAVVVSHVCPLTGRQRDILALAEALRGSDTALVVDAAQSVGVVPIDLDPDLPILLVGTTMKWLLGIPGTGFLYAAPVFGTPLLDVGYAGLVDQEDSWPRRRVPDPEPGLGYLELGMPNTVSLTAATAGIRLIAEIGVPLIQSRVLERVDEVLAVMRDHRLDVRTPEARGLHAGVVAARTPSAWRIAARARMEGVDIGGYPWGLLRVDPHAFCTSADIERLGDVLRGALE
jgi:kynureninase